MSKVFDETYSADLPDPCNAGEIVKGGTGYGLDNVLPPEVEHTCPDYSLYPALTYDTAYGFLTRGCPRGCGFCIVGKKEGLASRKVADLTQFWQGQRQIKLLDPNLLACPEHFNLLGQLSQSGAWVDFTQGLDARLLNQDNIWQLNQMRMKEIHFAWDFMEQSEQVLEGLRLYASLARRKPHGKFGAVYVLTNYDTTMEENIYRIDVLRDLGYDPYVMIYDKPNAPREIRRLQRWCNNRVIFNSCPDFRQYRPGKEARP